MINFPTSKFKNFRLNDYPKFLLKIVISGLGIQTLKSPIDGILKNIYVIDGEKIEKNQELFEFDGRKLNSKLVSYERELELHFNDLKNIENDCILVDNLLQTKIKIAKKEYAVQEGILLKFESLINEGAISELDYLNQKSRFLDTQNTLNQTKTNIELQKTECQTQSNELNLKISKVNNEKKIANTSLKELIVSAPGNGFIYDFYF